MSQFDLDSYVDVPFDQSPRYPSVPQVGTLTAATLRARTVPSVEDIRVAEGILREEFESLTDKGIFTYSTDTEYLFSELPNISKIRAWNAFGAVIVYLQSVGQMGITLHDNVLDKSFTCSVDSSGVWVWPSGIHNFSVTFTW